MDVDNLTRAFIRGAALAAALSACGEAVPTKQPDAGLMQRLDPIPDRRYPHCVGPVHSSPDDGYSGQCCGDVQCTETVAGRCPQLGSWEDLMGLEFPPGSGECGCEADEGPFARTAAADLEPGECCYVIYEIGCVGRPLKRDGAALVAEVVARTDWLGSAELPLWT